MDAAVELVVVIIGLLWLAGARIRCTFSYEVEGIADDAELDVSLLQGSGAGPDWPEHFKKLASLSIEHRGPVTEPRFGAPGGHASAW